MAAGAVAAGVGLDIYASRKAMKQETAALEAQAAERELAATELMERFEIRSEISRMETTKLIGKQKAAFAKGNVDVGTGTPLLAAEEAFRLSERAISLEKREADFEYNQLLRAAEADKAAAEDERKAFKIRTISKVIQGGGQMYGAKQGAKPAGVS